MSRNEEAVTLARWLVRNADGEAYRAGRLAGWKHPKVDKKLIEAVGGMEKLLEQVRMLERDPELGGAGKLSADWRYMGGDIRQLHYDVSAVPLLCRREGMADPREEQLEIIARLEGWRAQVEDFAWILPYYDNLLEKLENGKKASETDDELLFKGLNAVVRQAEPVWERVFSAEVFGSSKKFKNGGYRERICTILAHYSPRYEEGMSDDELLDRHEIHSYAQTLEWKGPLVYQLDGCAAVDTAVNRYGTVLNSQTLEHAIPCSLANCRKIMTIENKANYENMPYAADTLYIFCHGFFSPKEMRFLKKLAEIAPSACEFCHWGDMDYGGIRIFQFIKGNLFTKLHPYKMGAAEFEAAVGAGAGISLEEGAREKLEKMDAGILDELKRAILETGLTIEQERLIHAIKE